MGPLVQNMLTAKMGGLTLIYLSIGLTISSRPLLLILDGHKTHYQLHVCQEAKKCFCLPHSPPRPFKTEWNKATHMFQSKNPGVQITKYNFPKLLKKAW